MQHSCEILQVKISCYMVHSVAVCYIQYASANASVLYWLQCYNEPALHQSLLWLPTNWMATTGRAIGMASSLFRTLKKNAVLPYSHLLPAASSITYKAHHAMHMVSQEWYVASQGCLVHCWCHGIREVNQSESLDARLWLLWYLGYCCYVCLDALINKICTSGPYSCPLLRCQPSSY